MAQPWKHPKTGIYYFRRSIPGEFRPLLGNKHEWKVSLRTRDLGKAKRLYLGEAQKYEAAMDAARAGRKVSDLSQKEVVALGAEWARRFYDQYKDEPGAAEDWGLHLDSMQEAEERGRPELVIEEELLPFLSEQGIKLDRDSASYRELVNNAFWFQVHVIKALLKRARGDYSTDTVLAGAPHWERPIDRSKTVQWALDQWITERKPAASTVREFRGVIRRFGPNRALGEITFDDVRTFKDQEVVRGLKPNSIDKNLSAVRIVFRWALSNKHIDKNPADGVKVEGIKDDRARKRRGIITRAETQKVLLAARNQTKPALRWVPWLLASTGCRLVEACQLLAGDVRREEGVWLLEVTDKGAHQIAKSASSKRLIPLHPQLIDEGFLNYVQTRPTGAPIFPEISPGSRGNKGDVFGKKLRPWMAKIVPGKTPHWFRHSFKTWAREASLSEDISDTLTGHAGGGAGRGYGDFTLQALSNAVAKIDFGASDL